MLPGSAPTERYLQQLSEKAELTRNQFKHLFEGELEVFSSPENHFRMRAEFKIWHHKESGEAHYAMHEPGVKNRPIVIDTFEIGSETIVRLMPALLKAINQRELLKKKLFQAEFLTTSSGEAVISLIYHRPLDQLWQEQAEELSKQLSCSIIGRSRKQKLVLGKNYVIENLEVLGRNFRYQQVETGFTQPNASVCRKMLEWACLNSRCFGGDLLELYCGNGNFTVPLALNFSKVLATEVSNTSVKSARFNFDINQSKNIDIARLSSEELTQALNGVRAFRRLKDIDLEGFNFSTIFVDPPRAGLDSGTVELASQFKNIIYISCNPNTLLSNLEVLQHTHAVKQLALFDQFPYTDHRECGVILEAKRPPAL